MVGGGPPLSPLIDVLIPAYNAADTIAESIACIQAQTITDLRIIVIDDGSSDATSAILENMAARDSRLVVRSQPNGGIVDALNKALSLSTAPFIARHDADDIAYPDRLERQMAYLSAHPDCVAVGANAWHIDGRGARMGTRTTFAGDVKPDAHAVPAQEPYLMHPFLLMRREALVRAGGYRYCFHSEDTDLYWRLLGVGRLHNLRDILGEYRIHSGSVSSASIRNGRVAAKYSQLSAVSYRRREMNVEDICFEKADLDILNEKVNFSQVISYKIEDLSEEERRYLSVASAAKLAELATYRPYVLPVDDCRQLGSMLKDLSSLPGDQRAMIRRSQAEVLRQYIDAGRWRQVLAFKFPFAVYVRLPKRYLWKMRMRLSARLRRKSDLNR